MKDVGLRIRVQKELRESFLAACRHLDKPASQVLREFMREFVEKSESSTVNASSRTVTDDDVKRQRKVSKS